MKIWQFILASFLCFLIPVILAFTVYFLTNGNLTPCEDLGLYGVMSIIVGLACGLFIPIIINDFIDYSERRG